jgi:hypothetical protein
MLSPLVIVPSTAVESIQLGARAGMPALTKESEGRAHDGGFSGYGYWKHAMKTRASCNRLGVVGP